MIISGQWILSKNKKIIIITKITGPKKIFTYIEVDTLLFLNFVYTYDHNSLLTRKKIIIILGIYYSTKIHQFLFYTISNISMPKMYYSTNLNLVTLVITL